MSDANGCKFPHICQILKFIIQVFIGSVKICGRESGYQQPSKDKKALIRPNKNINYKTINF
jgi:hypothetical protein